MNVERILWPTDFSENAAKALPVVTSLAQAYGAEIHILYVMKDYPAIGTAYGEYDPEEAEKMQVMEKEMAEKRLDKICTSFLNECPLYIRHIDVGDPGKVMLQKIKSEEIDIVVMASAGKESHFDFASVMDHLLKCTTIPLVAVPV